MDDDPRASRVEASVTDFYRVVSTAPGITTTDHGGLTTFTSGIPHPLLNGVLAGAALAPGTERQCVEEAVGRLQETCTPFLWWCGPSVWTTDVERALGDRGLQVEVLPGMHRQLPGPRGEPGSPPGATIVLGDKVELEAFTRTMAIGFDLPDDLVEPLVGVLGCFSPDQLVHAIALLDGTPVACGSLLLSGRTGGVYNIATLEHARRRGIGYAVTAALVDAARDRGCTESVLVATQLGEPVYRRLGFEPVCDIRECLWIPS